jgi:hypothetical protein
MMTERAIEQLLENYYANVPEPPGGLAAGRVHVLEAAAQHRAQMRATKVLTRKERKPKMRLLFATRLISAILAAVIGTAALGGGVTWAASDSLPGSVLYPVKLAGEDARLFLASTSESQVELALRFADERVAELQALVERGSSVPDTIVARMERHLYRAMNQAAWASDEEMPGLLKRIAQRTQVQAQTLLQLRTRAQVQNQAQLQNAHRICQRAQEEAAAGLGDPQTFRIRYQHRESMPEDVTPPEPPTRDPQEGGPGPQGTGGPDDPIELDSSQGEQPEDRSQDRDQSREGDQQHDRDRDRDQDREDDPQQDQDRDQQQEQQGDPPQDEGHNQQQEQQPDQERDQQQDQQPDQERDQQQDPQHDGQQGGSAGSNGPGS